MKKGKVQTNNDGVNVLVEHEDCSGKHYSHIDVDVFCENMTDEQINEEFDKITLTKKDKINILKKIKGFAISNCYNEQNKIYYDDLFKYKLKNG